MAWATASWSQTEPAVPAGLAQNQSQNKGKPVKATPSQAQPSHGNTSMMYLNRQLLDID